MKRATSFHKGLILTAGILASALILVGQAFYYEIPANQKEASGISLKDTPKEDPADQVDLKKANDAILSVAQFTIQHGVSVIGSILFVKSKPKGNDRKENFLSGKIIQRLLRFAINPNAP